MCFMRRKAGKAVVNRHESRARWEKPPGWSLGGVMAEGRRQLAWGSLCVRQTTFSFLEHTPSSSEESSHAEGDSHQTILGSHPVTATYLGKSLHLLEPPFCYLQIRGDDHHSTYPIGSYKGLARTISVTEFLLVGYVLDTSGVLCVGRWLLSLQGGWAEPGQPRLSVCPRCRTHICAP